MAQQPLYTTAEARSRKTFLAMMWSLSHPGRPYKVAEDRAFGLIGDVVLDLETSYYTPDEQLDRELLRTKARRLTPDVAAYHFYPQLSPESLEAVGKASVGSMLYPDEAATLIIGCRLNDGPTLRLTGPGIASVTYVRIGNVPEAFWSLRDATRHYPLGWDTFFVDGNQVLGLPRSTQVELS